jgi:hypothetical protein
MRIIALLVLALLTAPGVAMAKGPLSGSVSGPGLAAPIKLDGTGEWDEDSPLALLNAAYVVRQHLYPYAEHGPTVYTVRGQRIFDDTFRTTGGWYRVPRILIERLDLPARAVPARATVGPESPAGDGPSPLWAIAGVAMLAVVAWRGYDRRRRHPVTSRTP